MKRKIEEQDLEKILKEVFLQPPLKISQVDIEKGWAKIEKRIVESERKGQKSNVIPVK